MSALKIIVVSTFLILLSNTYAKTDVSKANLEKVEKEVSSLIDDDWNDMVKNGQTLDFCSSFVIKTYHQLAILYSKPYTVDHFTPQLAKEKIQCLESPNKTTLALLSKRAKKILNQYKIPSNIDNKWLEMRPYHLDRALYKAVANDKLDLYLRLQAYGANYGNTAIGHYLQNVALAYQANRIIEYLLKTKQISFNWTTNGGRAPLAILIDHKNVRHDFLEYALKHLKADPNYNGELSSYPIDIAVENGDTESVGLLIKYGAKVNLNSYNEFYCEYNMLLDKAIKTKNKGTIKVLREAGAKTYDECKNEE